MSKEDNVFVDDAVSALLYQLLMSEIPIGKLSNMVNVAIQASENGLPNNVIANHANELAEQLRSSKVTNMKEKLSKMFGESPDDEDEPEKELESPLFHRDPGEELEEELELLRPEIEDAARDLDPDNDSEELLKQAKNYGKALELEKMMELTDRDMSVSDIKDITRQLRDSNGISESKFSEIMSDLDEFEKSQEGKDGRTSEPEE